MKRMIAAASSTALLLSLGACATVVRGTSTDFKVASTPPGADVKTSTGYSCSPTPCVIHKMPRSESFDVTLTLDGYQPAVQHIRKQVKAGGAAGAAGNVALGGVVGLAVDALDGSMYDLVPNPLQVNLQPLKTASAQPDETQRASPPAAGTK